MLLALAMIAPARAQTGGEYVPRGQPTPQSIRWVNGNPGGATMSGSASWTNAYNQTSHHRFPVNYSSNTLGGLGRAALRRGLPLAAWAFAFKNLVEGAGWVIDELQNQVMDPGTPREELGSTAWCVTQQSNGQRRCASLPGQLQSVAILAAGSLYENPCTLDGFAASGGGRYRCKRVGSETTAIAVVEGKVTMPSSGWGSGYTNDNPGSEASPISDQELGSLIKNHASVVNGVSTDPDTGAPRRTAELTNAINTLARALEAANGLTPGELGELAPADDLAAPVPSQTEWPGFCDWATVVCEFIDWVKADEGEPKELPEHDLQINPNSWASGIGNGTCPAPIVETWTFMDTPARFEFDYQPVCQFASMMRPFLIACALICAAFIMAGLRSAGGKT